jgi:hypothetical protein
LIFFKYLPLWDLEKNTEDLFAMTAMNGVVPLTIVVVELEVAIQGDVKRRRKKEKKRLGKR